jgi:uncharacterized protein (UPF0335 family)
MTTLRQIESNRRNSKLSTGPRSEVGKEKSRSNSLKHGLSGAGVVFPDEEAEAVRQRTEDWAEDFHPDTKYGQWLAGQVALESLRIERCQQRDLALRIHLAERARTSWEEDRERAAEAIGEGLAKRPGLAVSCLQGTAQGCDWLLDRWRGLQAILEHQGQWADAHRALAFDLLRIPVELRDIPGPIDTPESQAVATRDAIEKLTRFQSEALDDLDEIEQEAATQGLPIVEDREVVRLRRYEAACRRQMNAALRQLAQGRGEPAEARPRDPVPTPASLEASTSPTHPGGSGASTVVGHGPLNAERERSKDLLIAEFEARRKEASGEAMDEFRQLSGRFALAGARPANTPTQEPGTPTLLPQRTSLLDLNIVPPSASIPSPSPDPVDPAAGPTNLPHDRPDPTLDTRRRC